MLKAYFKKYELQFRFNAVTSRGEMKFKHGYFLFIGDGINTGVGECSFIEGLSIDNLESYEATLQLLCQHIENTDSHPAPSLDGFPSIRFGWEMAKLDLEAKGTKILYQSDFTDGVKRIPINGLVWMGNKDFMLEQIRQKLQDGFRCIKVKVGAINFDDEIMLLDFIRQKFPADILELRLDANGAFKVGEVLKKLDILSKFHIHSIEQPVKQGQPELMKNVCSQSPIPVALDEELIDLKEATPTELLKFILPQYIILKPSLLGGIEVCNAWIKLAEEHRIGWWATSALESNVGLNAIAQWVFTKSESIVQGLGTGGLYTSNISSPLFTQHGYLGYNPAIKWGEV